MTLEDRGALARPPGPNSARGQPLAGGLPPEVAWPSLRIVTEEVLPGFPEPLSAAPGVVEEAGTDLPAGAVGILSGELLLADFCLRFVRRADHRERPVDMETAAVGSVCARAGCPWSVYRAISDRADDGSTDPAVLGLVDAEGRPKLATVARFLLTRPHRIPQLIRLARGTNEATARAARAALTALHTL